MIFKSSTIKFRMIFLSIFVVASMSMLGLTGYVTFAKIQRLNEVLELLKSQSTCMHVILRGLTEIVLIPDNPASAKMVKEKVNLFGVNQKKIFEVSNDSEVVASIKAQIAPDWKSVEEEVGLFLKISRPNPDDVDTMIMFGKLSANTDKLLKKIDRIQLATTEKTQRQITAISAGMAAGALLLIVITSLMLVSIFRSISNPLSEISAIAQKVSGGDLTVEPVVHGKDEIGKLAAAFKGMLSSLRQIINQSRLISSEVSDMSGDVKDSSVRVYSSVSLQTSAIQATASAVEDVDRSISRLRGNTNNLLDEANTASAISTELVSSISSVADNAAMLDRNSSQALSDVEEMVISGRAIDDSIANLNVATEETYTSILQIAEMINRIQGSAARSVILAEQVSVSATQTGMEAVQHAEEGIHNIKNQVSSIAEVVNRLGAKSLQIGKIITVIEGFASQTRLLALNAAILAAQAGKHGVSFAVVAHEIRLLADRTFLSTQEIVDVITSVQLETKSSVQMADKGIRVVDTGIELIDKVRKSLEDIAANSLLSTEMSRSIQHETSEETAVIEEINSSVDILKNQICEISMAVTNQTAGTMDLNMLVGQVKSIAHNIASATSEQSITSRQIAGIAERISSQAEEINELIDVQRKESGMIVQQIGCLRISSSELEKSAKALERTADDLQSRSGLLSGNIGIFRVSKAG